MLALGRHQAMRCFSRIIIVGFNAATQPRATKLSPIPCRAKTTLKDPFLNEPFDPSPMWLIGVFDIYDREQEVGIEISKYDPNKKSDREEPIKRYALNLSYLSYRHKYALTESSKNKLNDEIYNFHNLFEISEDNTGS
ncbi:hypothetical protein [Pseudomonas sp. R3-52-08]|uniref:hypothetical protein n=1 Tax=Pseudomonas sp. R3-52-08 TaxID=1173284 RepID=UPI0021147BD7|nr:hypothetical protein [Pseudomonas sp. R3-52-08]